MTGVIKGLRRHMPEYRKNRRGFDKLVPKLVQAIRHSRKALRQEREIGTDNLSTRVREVVAHMQKLAADG